MEPSDQAGDGQQEEVEGAAEKDLPQSVEEGVLPESRLPQTRGPRTAPGHELHLLLLRKRSRGGGAPHDQSGRGLAVHAQRLGMATQGLAGPRVLVSL